MNEANLILIGFGVIGKGVGRVLLKKRDLIRKRYKKDIRIVAVCEVDGSIIDKDGIDLKAAIELAEKNMLREHERWEPINAVDVIRSIKADVVLELTPGDIKTGEPGLTHIKEAVEQGMNVVTSNKAPLALKFRELMKEAQKNNVRLRYEATVGGGIPIINLYDDGLRINEIKSVYGILNGTSNYILSKMEEELLDLETALKEAKELGIAESDPSYDIKGIDTGAKVAILANSLMDMEVSFKDINIVGIEDITPEAVDLAKKHGYSIKLIGDVRRLEVSPRLIPMDHPMNVSGFLNAITINTDLAKDITLIGRGAGAEETASSIFSDILSILDH